ncbi:hypothetical protein HMPREF1992_00149 [Selenomonas sp. oral taxon 892 str. F0426]|nr:hypothetical protein HMPREF1992_00149 [Selenomonas sp. oral taxon 892 str. F0426]
MGSGIHTENNMRDLINKTIDTNDVPNGIFVGFYCMGRGKS